MADYVVAIPARYASTRLPGKPLASVGGEPMIRVVCTQALQSQASRVIACVDDERVYEVLKGCGAEICMTSKDCHCGTDRIAQMLEKAFSYIRNHCPIKMTCTNSAELLQ